jgi:hypothetical protein
VIAARPEKTERQRSLRLQRESAPSLHPRWLHAGRKFLSASLTSVEEPSAARFSHRLEKRLLSFCEACWAKPMRWFGAACLRLQHIGHSSESDWLQFIILLLSIPCFQASHFCFERAYFIGLRRLSLAGSDGLIQD